MSAALGAKFQLLHIRTGSAQLKWPIRILGLLIGPTNPYLKLPLSIFILLSCIRAFAFAVDKSAITADAYCLIAVSKVQENRLSV